MARIAGVDLPKNKQAWVSLQYIYGVGPTLSHKILEQANVKPDTKVTDLSEEEVNRIRELIDKQVKVEGDLRKEITFNIKRLIEIGSYRGYRHRRSLPVRGQSTKTNARSRKGPRKTVAGRGQKRGLAKK